MCKCYAVCRIEALSWGNQDTTRGNGYISINGNSVGNTNYRGFNLVELNATSCSPTNVLQYDTCVSTADSDNMATYINNLPLNKVLIGVTIDDASFSLTQNAKNALLSIGVDVTGLQFRGKLAFAAQRGQPAIAAVQVAPTGGNNLKLTVNVTGAS